VRQLPAGEPKVQQTQQAALDHEWRTRSQLDRRVNAFPLATGFLEAHDVVNLSLTSKAIHQSLRSPNTDRLFRQVFDAQEECRQLSRQLDEARSAGRPADETERLEQGLSAAVQARDKAIDLVRCRALAARNIEMDRRELEHDDSVGWASAGRMLGLLAFGRPQYLDAAEKLLRQSIRAHGPDTFEANRCRAALAEVLLRMGRYDDAIEEAEGALEDVPREAQQVLDAAAALQGNYSPLAENEEDDYRHIKLCASKGDVQGAIKALNSFLSDSELSSGVHTNLQWFELFTNLSSPCMGPIEHDPDWQAVLERFYMAPAQLASFAFKIPTAIPVNREGIDDVLFATNGSLLPITSFLETGDAVNLSLTSPGIHRAVTSHAADPLLQDVFDAQAAVKAACQAPGEDHSQLQEAEERLTQAIDTLKFRDRLRRELLEFAGDIQAAFDKDPAAGASGLGLVLMFKGQLAQAERVLQWGIAQNAGNPEAKDACSGVLALVYMKSARFDKALAVEMGQDEVSRHVREIGKLLQEGDVAEPAHPDDEESWRQEDGFMLAARNGQVKAAIAMLDEMGGPSRLVWRSGVLSVLELMAGPVAQFIQDDPEWQAYAARFFMAPSQLASLPVEVPAWVPSLEALRAGGTKLDEID
jgi:tetratricopeptide (TPR) repeat protein